MTSKILVGFWKYLKDKFSSGGNRLINSNLGQRAIVLADGDMESQVGKYLTGRLLGFTFPTSLRKKLKLLKKAEKAIQEEIKGVQLEQQQQQLSVRLIDEQQGAYDYRIENTIGVRTMMEVKDEFKEPVRAAVLPHLKAKLNLTIGTKMVRQVMGR